MAEENFSDSCEACFAQNILKNFKSSRTVFLYLLLKSREETLIRISKRGSFKCLWGRFGIRSIASLKG